MTQTNMSDMKTTIEEMKARIRAFRDERGWHAMESPKDASLSLVLEAAELLEHFQWMSDEEVRAEKRLRGPIADELADVLWWVMVVADSLDLDVSRAFEMKLAKNEKKYPAESFAPGKSGEEKRRAYYKIKAQYRGGHPLADDE